ncbi:MAG: DinB family protein [Dehalococcoidia bacterium]|nr:DinB family protein [Dehalococcoidia bacterium]MDW8120503.1 DinB family protein [Chloroflexota bacterium]
MTTLQAFLAENLANLHRNLIQAVQGLTPAQLHYKPAPHVNHIAFILWHYVRTEDNCVRFVFRRMPTIWMEGGWDKRFGLDSKSQGTGFTPQQAEQVRLPSVDEFLAYARLVFQETEQFVAGLSDADLERKVLVRPLGEHPLRFFLGTTFLTHGYGHLGEIWFLKGMQGLPGSPV